MQVILPTKEETGGGSNDAIQISVCFYIFIFLTHIIIYRFIPVYPLFLIVQPHNFKQYYTVASINIFYTHTHTQIHIYIHQSSPLISFKN